MSIVFRNNTSSKLKNTTSESATILIQTVSTHTHLPQNIPFNLKVIILLKESFLEYYF